MRNRRKSILPMSGQISIPDETESQAIQEQFQKNLFQERRQPSDFAASELANELWQRFKSKIASVDQQKDGTLLVTIGPAEKRETIASTIAELNSYLAKHRNKPKDIKNNLQYSGEMVLSL